jgi:acid phosphatase type 7
VSRAAGSPHEAWLRAELAALPARHCVLDYWHHPRLSSGFGGAHQPQTPRLNRWWMPCVTDGAELILTAHSHNYERFDLSGPTQFVVGTGGRDLHANTGPPLTATLRTDVFGVVELTLGPAGWSSRFIAEGGTAIDAASGTC